MQATYKYCQEQQTAYCLPPGAAAKPKPAATLVEQKPIEQIKQKIQPKAIPIVQNIDPQQLPPPAQIPEIGLIQPIAEPVAPTNAPIKFGSPNGHVPTKYFPVKVIKPLDMQRIIYECKSLGICPTGPKSRGTGSFPAKLLFSLKNYKEAYTQCRKDGTAFC